VSVCVSVQIGGHLSKLPPGHFIAGGKNLTSADFMMVFTMEVMQNLVPDWTAPEKSFKEYINTLHDRPAYKRGLDKGGKYDYA